MKDEAKEGRKNDQWPRSAATLRRAEGDQTVWLAEATVQLAGIREELAAIRAALERRNQFQEAGVASLIEQAGKVNP